MALIPMGDAMAGMAGGNVVKSIQNTVKANKLYSKAEAALAIAEEGRETGTMNSAEYMQQANKATDLYNQAKMAKSGGRGSGSANNGGEYKLNSIDH